MKSLLLATCGVLVLQSVCAEQTIHAVFVSDSNNEDLTLRRAFEEVKKNFLREVEFASQACDLRLNRVLITTDVTSAAVMQQLRVLDVTGNDVVVYYSFSHGFRATDQEDPLPWAVLSGSRATEELRISFRDIVQEVEKKKPKLGIVVADCCNGEIGVRVDQLRSRVYSLSVTPERSPKVYQQLFLSSAGMIEVSAFPGEELYFSDSGTYLMSAMSQTLLEFGREDREALGWQSCINRASEILRQRLQNEEVGKTPNLGKLHFKHARSDSSVKEIEVPQKLPSAQIVFRLADNLRLFLRPDGTVTEGDDSNESVGRWVMERDGEVVGEVRFSEQLFGVPKEVCYLREDGSVEARNPDGVMSNFGFWYPF
jgi:hypothetical protein